MRSFTTTTLHTSRSLFKAFLETQNTTSPLDFSAVHHAKLYGSSQGKNLAARHAHIADLQFLCSDKGLDGSGCLLVGLGSLMQHGLGNDENHVLLLEFTKKIQNSDLIEAVHTHHYWKAFSLESKRRLLPFLPICPGARSASGGCLNPVYCETEPPSTKRRRMFDVEKEKFLTWCVIITATSQRR
jgi:hypothetical protein